MKNIKKNAFLMVPCILCILLVSCGSPSDKVDLKDGTGMYKNFVITEALALEIGRAVLKDTYGEVFSEETLTVKEVEKQKFFVVSFTQEGYALGGDFNVAINKKDGKILKIWAGE